MDFRSRIRGSDLGFGVSDLGFRVSDLGFGVSDLGFGTHFGPRMSDSGSDLDSEVDFGSRSDPGVGFRSSDLRFWTSDVGFRGRDRILESDFGPRISDIGVRAFNFGLHPEIGDSKSRVAGPQNCVFEPISCPFWTLIFAPSRRVTGVTAPLKGELRSLGVNHPPDSDPKWFSIRLPA